MKKNGKKASELSGKKKEKMRQILSKLKKKMAEVDRLKQQLDYRQISFSLKPKETRAMIEEIKVPSLELIKDQSVQKK